MTLFPEIMEERNAIQILISTGVIRKIADSRAQEVIRVLRAVARRHSNFWVSFKRECIIS
jgi:hypothetical protein